MSWPALSPSLPNRAGLLSPLQSVWRNLPLAWEMGRRDLILFNKGTVLGLGWLVVRPFMQTAAYVFIISIVFGVHFGPKNGGRFSYAIYILAGMVPWQFMTSVLQDAPSLLRSRIELLKQIVYPVEILPITSVMIAAIGPLVSLLVYVVLAGIEGGLHWSILLLPMPAVMLIAMLVGCAWVLMVIGLLLADLREIIGLVMGILVYMSPVVITDDAVPTRVWHILELSPLFHVVVCFRDVFASEFHPMSWVVFASTSFVAMLVGAFSASRARRLFGEF